MCLFAINIFCASFAVQKLCADGGLVDSINFVCLNRLHGGQFEYGRIIKWSDWWMDVNCKLEESLSKLMA